MKTRILDTGNKKDIKIFKSVPFRIFKGNRFWVPPFPGEIEKVMDRESHPFYAHSEADFIVVENEHEALGRIAVLKNNNYCEFHKQNIAFFYYFECLNDKHASQALFSAAEEWCNTRGIKQIYGPRGFLRSNCIGQLVEGFNALPATGMIYNHDYYPELIESAGFKNSTDHYSGFLDQHLDPKLQILAKKVLARGNFEIINFRSTDEMIKWIPKVDEVHHRAFADNPGFYPSTPEEFKLLSENIIAIADPRYIKLIMHGEKIAGFLIAFPNINKGLQFARGKLFPFGWIGILLDRRYSRVIDMNGIGLLPEYQGLGGNAVLYAEVDKVLLNSRFKRAEIVQVDERNFRSKSDMNTMKVQWDKIHRTYIKEL